MSLKVARVFNPCRRHGETENWDPYVARTGWKPVPQRTSVGDANMKFPPAQNALKPLDLAGPHRAAPRKLEANDLDPTARLAKPGAANSQHEKLVKQTRNWVAQTFFGTLLKQMENSPFK